LLLNPRHRVPILSLPWSRARLWPPSTNAAAATQSARNNDQTSPAKLDLRAVSLIQQRPGNINSTYFNGATLGSSYRPLRQNAFLGFCLFEVDQSAGKLTTLVVEGDVREG